MGCGTRVGMVPGAVGGWVEEVLAGYRFYLRSERGVGEATVAGYEPDARLLLRAWPGSRRLDLDELTAPM